jgi:hypothetical protein
MVKITWWELKLAKNKNRFPTTDWQGLHIPGCARPQWNLCVFVFLNEQLNKVCIFQGVLNRNGIYAYLCFWMNNWTRFAYSRACQTAVESMRICVSEWTTDKVCIFQARLDRIGIYAYLCVWMYNKVCIFQALLDRSGCVSECTNNVCIFQALLDRRGIYAYLCFWMYNWQGLHIPGSARPQWNLCVFVFLNVQLTRLGHASYPWARAMNH